jgi:hypothetical protein
VILEVLGLSRLKLVEEKVEVGFSVVYRAKKKVSEEWVKCRILVTRVRMIPEIKDVVRPHRNRYRRVVVSEECGWWCHGVKGLRRHVEREHEDS